MKTKSIPVVTLIAFMLAFAIGTVVTILAVSNQRSNQRQAVTQVTSIQAKSLERELYYALSSAFALAAAMAPDGGIDNFDELAARMLQHYQGIGNLQLAPNAVVSQIFPLEGNEAAIGHDLLNDPNRRADVLLAMETREMTLAGPFELVQGGTGVIGRYPVFLENGDFWGLTIALIHLEDLLAASDLTSVAGSGYDYQLSRIDPVTGERRLFAYTIDQPLPQPVVFPLRVANNQWELALTPAGGWDDWYLAGLGMVAALGAAVVVAALSHRLLSHMARMQTINEALAASQQRNRALLEIIPDTILSIDARGRCLEHIQAEDEQNGSHLVGQSLMSIFGAPAAGDLHTGIQLALETGHAQTVEYQRPGAPATDDTASNDTTCDDIDYEARIVGMSADEALVIIRDVTMRKQMEAALRQSEQRYRTVADLNTDWTYWQKADGSLEYVSPACEAICGYTPEELRGTPALIWQIIVVEDLPIWENHLHPQAGEERTRSIQLRIQHKDGSIRWIEHTCRPVFNEVRMFDGYHVNNRDITRRKESEKALRSSQSHYQLLADNMADVVWLMDLPTMRFTYVSPSVERLRGYTPEEVIAQPIDHALTPESLELVASTLPGRIADFHNGDPDAVVQMHDIQQKCKDGSTVWTEVVTTLIQDEDTGDLTVLGVSRDITERLQAQQHEIQARLEKERVGLLTNFIQNTAHEFRTPLSIINTNAYLMTRADDVDVRRDKASQIASQVERTSDLVDKLTAVATLESSLSMVNIAVDVNALADSIWRHMNNVHGSNRLIEFTPGDDLPMVYGNPHYLSDAITQLMDNAANFTPPGGTIRIVTGADDDSVWLEVQDSGPGIPEEILPHIFDTFWRQDKARSTPGLGLGLTIARRIVQLHDGQLSAASDFGQGATFRMTLPAAAPDTLIGVNDQRMIDHNMLK